MSSGRKKGASSSKDEKPNLDFLTSGGSGLGRRPATAKISSSSDRLPSVRPKRDLTLGGVPKKSFAPTIPTSRPIKKDPSELESPVASRKKGRDEKRDRKDKNKGKRKGKEIITSASVFSMGPADRGHGRSRGSSFGGGGGGGGGSQGADDFRFAKKPAFLSDGNSDNSKSNLHVNEDIDPIEGAGVDDLFSNSKYPPTQLPLDYQLHTKTRVVVPKQVKVVKEEPMDFTDATGQADSMEGGNKEKQAEAIVAPPTEVKVQQTKIADLFTPEDSSKGQFLFLQLPDCLPANKGVASESKESEHSPPTKTSATSSESKKGDESEETAQRHCSMGDLSEGLVGKLTVHKSGRVRLTLGEVSFNIAMGTPCGFLQELACVRNEKPEPKLTILGQLSHRLVCTPDFDSLLEQSELQ